MEKEQQKQDQEDYLVRAIAAKGQIRAFAATTKGLVEYARQAHNTSPVVTAALGRFLTGAAIMGSMMKGDSDLLTLRINCDGPVKGLLATADSKGNVKGYAFEPGILLPPSPQGKLDVGAAVGSGTLSVVKDLGLKEPYVGRTDLVSGEIAEDLTYYFAVSEQVPSSVALGVLMNKENTVRQAGGFILQLLPNAEESLVDRLEQRLASLPPVTALLDEGQTPEEILKEVLGEFDVEITASDPIQFRCGCSRERVEKALISTGRRELEEMIAEGKPVEAGCHFCGAKYTFPVTELENLLKRAGSPEMNENDQVR